MELLKESVEQLLKETSYRKAASRLGVDVGAIRSVINGRTPRIQTIEKMCQGLGLNFDFRITTGKEAKQEPKFELRKIPVLGMATCGNDGWAYLGANDMSASLPDRRMSDDSFAVIASGDSMRPFGIYPGAVCYCDPDVETDVEHLVFIEHRNKSMEKSRMAIKKLVMMSYGGSVDVMGYYSAENDAQKIYYETIYNNEIIRLATVCWINTNPVL